VQSKGCSKVLHLSGRQCLGEDVGHHVISRAIDKSNGNLLDNSVDPVIMHVNVLGPQMVLVVVHECDGSLVIRKESDGGSDVAKDLGDEAVKLKGFLATVHCCDILALGGRQGDDLLLL
jgi:hypothetical protein